MLWLVDQLAEGGEYFRAVRPSLRVIIAIICFVARVLWEAANEASVHQLHYDDCNEQKSLCLQK